MLRHKGTVQSLAVHSGRPSRSLAGILLLRAGRRRGPRTDSEIGYTNK